MQRRFHAGAGIARGDTFRAAESPPRAERTHRRGPCGRRSGQVRTGRAGGASDDGRPRPVGVTEGIPYRPLDSMTPARLKRWIPMVDLTVRYATTAMVKPYTNSLRLTGSRPPPGGCPTELFQPPAVTGNGRRPKRAAGRRAEERGAFEPPRRTPGMADPRGREQQKPDHPTRQDTGRIRHMAGKSPFAPPRPRCMFRGATNRTLWQREGEPP